MRRKEVWVLGIVFVLVAVGAVVARVVGPQIIQPRTSAGFVESHSGKIQQVVAALADYSSFNMIVESSESTWDVDYANMDQSEKGWLASGTYRESSGFEAIFDSRYDSTCLRVLKPTEGTWVFHQHPGWRTGNRDYEAFSPPIPLIGLKVKPPYEWVLDRENSSEVVLSAEITAEGTKLRTTLYVDPVTYLVIREERQVERSVVANKYSGYRGDGLVTGVHISRAHCKGRNQ